LKTPISLLLIPDLNLEPFDEESAFLDGCNAQVELVLTLPDDVSDFISNVTALLTEWNKCLQKWISRHSYANWDFETDINDDNQKKVSFIQSYTSMTVIDAHITTCKQNSLAGFAPTPLGPFIKTNLEIMF